MFYLHGQLEKGKVTSNMSRLIQGVASVSKWRMRESWWVKNNRNLKDGVIFQTLIYVRILPRPVITGMEDEDLSFMGGFWEKVEVIQGPSQVAWGSDRSPKG